MMLSSSQLMVCSALLAAAATWGLARLAPRLGWVDAGDGGRKQQRVPLATVGGAAIGLALAQYRDRLARVYAADLMGAGLGSLGVVLLLFVLFPMPALQLLSAMGVVAALVAV